MMHYFDSIPIVCKSKAQIRTNLKMCKSRSLSLTQLLKLNQPLDGHNLANINSKLSNNTTKGSTISIICQQHINEGNHYLEINYRNLTCFYTPITLPIQLGIGQSWHDWKKWNLKSYPTICKSKQFDKNSVQNAQKQIAHVELKFRWIFDVQEKLRSD